MSPVPGRTAIKPEQWGRLAALLLDFHAFPGRYATVMHEPRPLYEHATEVLLLAAGRAVKGLPNDAELQNRLREAARFFVRMAMLRHGADHYTLLGVAPGFDGATLREHYRMLIRLTHPDFAAAGEAWPPDAATRINMANDVLASPERRQAYDYARLHRPRLRTPGPARGYAHKLGGRGPRRRWPAVVSGVMLLVLWLFSLEAPHEGLATLVPDAVPETPRRPIPEQEPVGVAPTVPVVPRLPDIVPEPVVVATPVAPVAVSGQQHASAPVPIPVPAVVAAAASAPAVMEAPRTADVQPLLGQLLGALQSGRSEQAIRLVDRSTRQGDGESRLTAGESGR